MKTMEEQYISFELAKLAKEKGLDILNENMKVYANENIPQLQNYNEVIWAVCEDYCLAPTQSLLQRWLREKHLIDVFVLPQIVTALNPLPLYFYVVEDYRNGEWKESVNSSDSNNKEKFLHFELYENALEKGLFEALILI